jgi:hypothetical protein
MMLEWPERLIAGERMASVCQQQEMAVRVPPP